MKRGNKMEMHFFYCLNCGKLAYELPRKISRQYRKGHLKKMYCPHCKTEGNMYECRNEIEAYDFKQRYENGEFEQEAKDSIDFCKKEKLKWKECSND